MADVNFGILDTQAPGRIAAIPQQAQAQQTQNMLTALQAQQTMRQGEVSQMQLQKMKQSEVGLEKIRQASISLGGPPNLRAIANAYLSSGDPEHMRFGVGLVKELDQQDQFKSIMQGPTNNLAPAPAPAPAPTGAAPAPMEAAPANNLAPKVQGLPSNVLEMQNKRDKLITLGTPQALAMAAAIEKSIELVAKPFMHNVPGVGTVDARGQVLVPVGSSEEIRTMRELGYPNTQAGYTAFRDAQRQERLLTPAEESQKVRIAGASRAPAQPRPEQPPVAVIDPVTNKPIYVSRDEAITKRLAPATALEGVPPKEIQRREAVFPQAAAAVKGFEAKSESFIKDLKALRDHPGLSSITGIAAGRMPGLTSDGRAAQALYDKIVAKGGFQALQDLRDASKTGGALGNVSNQEGKQLTSSFAAIDRRQDAPEVQAAIDQAISDVEGTRTRVREAYDSTYEYRAAPKPGKPGKPSLTDIFGG